MKKIITLFLFLITSINLAIAGTVSITALDEEGRYVSGTNFYLVNGHGYSMEDILLGRVSPKTFSNPYGPGTLPIGIMDENGVYEGYLADGDYTLLVNTGTGGGYKITPLDISISGDKTIDVTLVETNKGHVVFSIGGLEGVNVNINGENYLTNQEGHTEVIELTEGEYTVTLTKEGYQEKIFTNEIDSGKYELSSTSISLEEGCTESWSCSSWGSCINGFESRSCSDSNSCGTTVSKPDISRACTNIVTDTCSENWECTDWSECEINNQKRSCSDSNSCGTLANKPPESQSCIPGKCSEEWECTDWSECIDSSQLRKCEDKNNCGTIANKPDEDKMCDDGSEYVEDHSIEINSPEHKEILRQRARYKLSNGTIITPKLIPEEASEKAIERLGELNFSVKIREVEINGEKSPVYIAKANKTGRFLGLFKINGELETRIDPNSGEIISTKKPWWAFLARGI